MAGILCPEPAGNNGLRREIRAVPLLDTPSPTRDHRSTPCSFPRRGQPAPLGVLYDSSLDGGIDQVLALAMLFGYAALQQVRIPSLTTSRFTLQNAAFLDAVARFFAADLAGDFVPNKIPLPIGMASTGKQADAVASDGVGPAREGRRRRQAGPFTAASRG